MKNKIKILGIFTNYVENHAWMFKVIKNYHVTIVSDGKIISGKIVRPLKRNDIQERNIDFIKTPIIFNNQIDYIIRFFYILFLIPYFAKKDYKLVVFFSPPHFISLLSPLFKIFRIKTSAFITDDWVESAIYQKEIHGTFWLKTILRFIEFFAIKNMDYVFVVCEYLKKLYYPFNKNITIVPTSTDVIRVNKIKQKRISAEPTIVYLGAMFEYKGVIILANAFNLVKKKIQNVKLLMIGGGPALEKLKKLAKDDEDMIILGPIEYNDAIALTKGSDVAVIPFKKVIMNWTGSPLKFFDYMACCVPMVYTGGGQHSIFIQKYNVGIEVNDTPEDLADKITILLKNEKLRNKLKSNCIKNKSKIDYRVLFKPYVEVVDKLVQ